MQNNDFLPRKWEWIAVLGILALGAFLRFTNLATPSIWIDELNHYYAAETLLQDGQARFPSGEPDERALPYSYLVALSFRIFGQNEFALRLPSALFGVLALLVLYWICRALFGQVTALFAALFMAISPFCIGWSRLSRMYTFFQVTFMLGAYFFYRGFEAGAVGGVSGWQRRLLQRRPNGWFARWLHNWKLDLPWLAAALPFFFLAWKLHRITALFAIGIVAYCLLMLMVEWRSRGARAAVTGKYFAVLAAFLVGATLTFLLSAKFRAFLDYAVHYAPKWSEGTRFRDRKLYFNFLFDHYQFPMGALFVIGAYQVLVRAHRAGLYFLSLFAAQVAMFSFVFSYRHFQYLFNVYGFMIALAAFAFANIFTSEYGRLLQNWVKRKRETLAVRILALALFLVWLPATPSVRLARRIPLSEDGSYNGAMYLEEWRDACGWAKQRAGDDDIIISSDALGTYHYFGRVDFDLNFSDLALAQEENVVDENGRLHDLYSGAPFLTSTAQLERLLATGKTVWVLFQHYKFYDVDNFITPELRRFILEHFEKVYTTPNNTVVVFRRLGDAGNTKE